MTWNKENQLYFAMGGFFGIGLTFEGIGKFMGLTLGYWLGLISFVITLIFLYQIKNLNKKKS